MTDIAQLLNDPHASMVDVRSPEEFAMGHVEGSVNIPIQEVPHRVEEFRAMPKPIILFCASGNRSGHAMQFLQQLGIAEVHNGGGWMDVNDMRHSR